MADIVLQLIAVNLSRDQMTVLSHYSPHIILHTALNLIRIIVFVHSVKLLVYLVD